MLVRMLNYQFMITTSTLACEIGPGFQTRPFSFSVDTNEKRDSKNSLFSMHIYSMYIYIRSHSVPRKITGVVLTSHNLQFRKLKHER